LWHQEVVEVRAIRQEVGQEAPPLLLQALLSIKVETVETGLVLTTRAEVEEVREVPTAKV
jgi:hypothetical protein